MLVLIICAVFAGIQICLVVLGIRTLVLNGASKLLEATMSFVCSSWQHFLMSFLRGQVWSSISSSLGADPMVEDIGDFGEWEEPPVTPNKFSASFASSVAFPALIFLVRRFRGNRM